MEGLGKVEGVVYVCHLLSRPIIPPQNMCIVNQITMQTTKVTPNKENPYSIGTHMCIYKD